MASNPTIFQMILENNPDLKEMTYLDLHGHYKKFINKDNPGKDQDLHPDQDQGKQQDLGKDQDMDKDQEPDKNQNQAGELLRASLEFCASTISGTKPNDGKGYIEAAQIHFSNVGKHIARLLKDEAFNIYKETKKITGCAKISEVCSAEGKKTEITEDANTPEDNSKTNSGFKDTDLLILTILMNRKDCILHLLKKRKQNIIYAALFASALLKSLSKLAESQEQLELGTSYSENSRFFETVACNVISEIFYRNKSKCHELLITTVEGYGCTIQTVMKFASSNELMQFLGTTACQSKLNDIWRGDMNHFTSPKQIIACTFIPFLIPSITIFSKKQSMEKTCTQRILNMLKVMYSFYNAPITKFWTYVIAYFCMVCCFATFVLTDLHPVSVKRPSSFEMFTLLWIFTVILEEMRQIWNYEQYSAWYKVQSWWGNAWNKFDAAMYFCFILAFILRLVCSVKNFWLAIMAYSISLAVFVLRTLHFFYVAKYTGPKVIMIGKMVRDIQFFIMIFVVVLVSFGIITQANLFPNSELEWQLLKKIVYLPYWQLYGELFLDNMEGKEPSYCTSEVSLYSNGTLPRCPESNALVPLVLAIYMVFTNILLINLVIAMFSDTFQKVHANSVLVWKFYRYSLVYEYYERPFLIPPLIVVNHLYRILQFLIRKSICCTRSECCKKIMIYNNAFQRESRLDTSDESEENSLRTVLAEFGITTNLELSSSRSFYGLTKISATEQKLDKVLKRFGKMESRLNQLSEEITNTLRHSKSAKERKIEKEKDKLFIDVTDPVVSQSLDAKC